MQRSREAWPERRRLLATVFVLNAATIPIYLWTKKRAQFLERAAPTDQHRLGRAAPMRRFSACFPAVDVAEEQCGWPPIGG